jgi:hypothetical protein
MMDEDDIWRREHGWVRLRNHIDRRIELVKIETAPKLVGTGMFSYLEGKPPQTIMHAPAPGTMGRAQKRKVWLKMNRPSKR